MKNEALNDMPEIEQQKPHFKSLLWLPILVGALIAACGLIYGIATAILTSSVGVFFIYTVIGVVVGVITFIIMRIVLSSQILTVLYLEKICKDVAQIKRTNNASVAPEQLIETGKAVSESAAVPQEKSGMKDALNLLSAVLETSAKDDFYNRLKDWFEKFREDLLKLNVDIYKEINLFFYNSQDKVSEITDEAYKKIKADLRELVKRGV